MAATGKSDRRLAIYAASWATTYLRFWAPGPHGTYAALTLTRALEALKNRPARAMVNAQRYPVAGLAHVRGGLVLVDELVAAHTAEYVLGCAHTLRRVAATLAAVNSPRRRGADQRRVAARRALPRGAAAAATHPQCRRAHPGHWYP